LAGKIVKLDDKEIDRLFALTNGIPMYVVAVCERYKEYKDIDKAFVVEILSKQGAVYNALKFNLQESLGRARGQTLLFSIVKVLASNKPLRLTDISSKIYRSGTVTKSLVDRLVKVDLVSKNERLFTISDPVMKFFVNNVYVEDNELGFILDKLVVNKMAKVIAK
jgi:hypothetical protein